MTDPVKMLMVSDVHFGVKDVNQTEMSDAFIDTIFPVLKETDIFFINGDFFDDLVSFDNNQFDPIYETVLMTFHLCELYKIKLRVLQGTWSHDRNQLKRFNSIYKNNHFTFDYRFIDTIDLEEISFGERSLRFFFIPDDLPFKTSDDIVDVLKNKMVEKDWEYVDYGCMHGFVYVTVGKEWIQENALVFKEAKFAVVGKAIDVGRVRQHRISGNVFSNGSFDRLCHGDEDPKGCIRFFDYPDKYTATFIENKQAAVYDTVFIPESADTETITKIIDGHMAGLSFVRKINIRFLVDSSEQYEAIKSLMKEKYPDVKIARKKSSDKPDNNSMILKSTTFISNREKKISPTRKTLPNFIRAHIPDEIVISIEGIKTHLEYTD